MAETKKANGVMAKTILTILGTRPEAVKMAPVIQSIAKYSDQLRNVVCVTGQHRDMVHPILELFQIQADIDLDVMQHNQTLTGLTARLLHALDRVIDDVHPDWILAQGDTTSVMVASLVAYYHRVAFGHIEAGLRTGDKYQPFPEEGNRLIADLLADACFAPTPHAKENLIAQAIPENRIFITGNTVVDALQYIVKQPYDSPVLSQLPQKKRVILVTAHRRENFGKPIRNICAALQTLARECRDAVIVYPVHPNPNIQKPVHELLSGIENIVLLPPIGYRDMVALMQKAALILTDSGGIQEEAPTFGVPILVLREATERPEGVQAGIAQLVGTKTEAIVRAAFHHLEQSQRHQYPNPYGDGKAAERIVQVLLNHNAHE